MLIFVSTKGIKTKAKICSSKEAAILYWRTWRIRIKRLSTEWFKLACSLLVQVCILKVVAITIIVVSVVPRCLDLKPASLPSGLSEPYPVEVAPLLLDQRLICTELRQDFWAVGCGQWAVGRHHHQYLKQKASCHHLAQSMTKTFIALFFSISITPHWMPLNPRQILNSLCVLVTQSCLSLCELHEL